MTSLPRQSRPLDTLGGDRWSADSPLRAGHRRVSFHQDPATGLRAIVALHALRDGRTVGGIRCRAYESESDALEDVLRLSQAMTYKSVLAGIGIGGGKSVVILAPGQAPDRDLMHTMGDVVQSFGGAYVCAPDVGTGPTQLRWVEERTAHVVGLHEEASQYTARGVLRAIDAVARWTFDRDDLRGLRIGIQGVGNVGGSLAKMLARAGAEVTVSDVDAGRARELAEEISAAILPAEEIHRFKGDMFVPAALGGTINAATIPQLQVKAVVGPANNQLAQAEDAGLLHARGIDMVPDIVASAGGVIAGFHELGTFDQEAAHAQIDKITATALRVLEESRSRGTDPTTTALDLAREQLANETARLDPQ